VVVVSDGAMNASSDNFRIEILGQGAHGARPHESIDAVVVGSLMVMALQTIVSREIDPARPSVVSVGLFQAGTAPNVIAGRAVLEGTVRAQDHEVRQQLSASIKRIAESIAQLHGAKITIAIRHGTPPLVNTADMASLAREAARQAVGERTRRARRQHGRGRLQLLPGAHSRRVRAFRGAGRRARRVPRALEQV
jgi:hippurate hydrolase